MMKSIRPTVLLFSVFLLATLTAHAGGGSEAGNGGGIAEKNILFAYANLENYMDLCLQTTLCRLDPSQTTLLTRIRNAMPEERKSRSKEPLVFESEAAHPGLFLLDGQIRVAKTGNHVGDRIEINTDLLYTSVGQQGTRAVDLPLAVSILIHELGHHQGEKSHLKLDVLGTRVQMLLMQQTSTTPMWNGQIELRVIQYNVVRRDEDKRWIDQFDQVLISYQGKIENLSDRLLENVSCPASAGPGSRPLGLRLYNFHQERGVTHDSTKSSTRAPLQLWYILSCKKGQESDHGNIELALHFRIPAVPSAPTIFWDKTEFTQRSCETDSAVCR